VPGSGPLGSGPIVRQTISRGACGALHYKGIILVKITIIVKREKDNLTIKEAEGWLK
jgi:hypothetical protein